MENQTDNLNDLLIKYSEGTMSSDDYEHLLDVLNHSSDEDVFNVLGMHWDSFSTTMGFPFRRNVPFPASNVPVVFCEHDDIPPAMPAARRRERAILATLLMILV